MIIMQTKKPKDRILATAARLFHQQGYNSTGINEVIAQANVAKSTLYQHFASKDKLCVAFLEQRHNSWFDKLKKVVEVQSGTKAQLLALFDFIMKMNESEDFRGCSFLNIMSEISSSQQEIATVIRSHKTDLQHYIANLSEPEFGGLTMHIYFLFESAIIESQLYKSQEPVLQIQQIVKSLLQ